MMAEIRRRNGFLPLFLVLAVACGGGDSTPTSTPPPGGDGDGDGDGTQQGQVVEIDLVNFQFSNANVTITRGTTVRWRNTTSTFHTVTPDGHSQWSEWETDSPGETFEVTFNQAGDFPYFCVPHRSIGMVGRITVQAGGS